MSIFPGLLIVFKTNFLSCPVFGYPFSAIYCSPWLCPNFGRGTSVPTLDKELPPSIWRHRLKQWEFFTIRRQSAEDTAMQDTIALVCVKYYLSPDAQDKRRSNKTKCVFIFQILENKMHIFSFFTVLPKVIRWLRLLNAFRLFLFSSSTKNDLVRSLGTIVLPWNYIWLPNPFDFRSLVSTDVDTTFILRNYVSAVNILL